MAENNENDREFNLRETELFDRRTVERHISRGLTTRDAYAEHLESLEDCAHLAQESDVFFTYTGDAPEQEVIITPEMVAARVAANQPSADNG